MKVLIKNKIGFCLLLVSGLQVGLFAQDSTKTKEQFEQVVIDGHILTQMIVDGDTLLIADLGDVSYTAPRKFNSPEDYRKYMRYKRYAAKVYPYAVKAIAIFESIENDTKDMTKRQRKRHIKKLNKQFKKEFKDELKNLTKTQGMILIKMIERKLDEPFYDLVKDLRGGFTAFYWHQLGKFYDYDLKAGYNAEDDKILEMILSDLDL